MSNNPFIRRQSLEQDSISKTKPPPLPPRRQSDRRHSVPSQKRHVVAATNSSSSSARTSSSPYSHSYSRFLPTSIGTPSTLIKDSLLAARQSNNDVPSKDISLHVLRRSSDNASRQNTSNLSTLPSPMQQVSEALHRAEEPMLPPPTRGTSKRSSERFNILAEPYIKVEPAIQLWSCTDVLKGISGSTPYAMIILNQPIERKETFVRAWTASELHLCADGGANRLHDLWTSDRRSR
jgi:hypothetical protein